MIERLHQSVVAVCPIIGVAIGRKGVSASVRIDFTPEATPQQQTDAQSVVDAFDWSDAAQTAWEESRQPERKSLREAAQQAISDIDTYLAIGSPNNAQVVAAVRRLAQINKAIIKRLIQID